MNSIRSTGWRWLAPATALLLSACGGGSDKPAGGAPQPAGVVKIDPAWLANFQPLPAQFDSQENPVTEAKAALGRKLYEETALSAANDISCNTCHDLARYGVDGKATSPGHKGQLGTRNSPTVFNAAGHTTQFWDGRAATIEEQAKGPVLNPVEMALPNANEATKRLRAKPEYAPLFAAAFPGVADPVTFDNAALAIGAFERTLATPSRWDRQLRGDPVALSPIEKAGLKTFVEFGCVTCHNGPLLGGNMFQKLGAVKAWPDAKDQGRFDVTKQEADRMMFKVPSLRNVTKTGPYMHDGAIATLEDVVLKMAEFQLGKPITPEQVQSLIAFMGALTGDPPKSLKPTAAAQQAAPGTTEGAN